MNRYTTAAKVGLFTTVTLLGGYYIYRFAAPRGAAGGGYAVYALMDDATGIAKHSQIRIAGIPVGNIESVKLEGDQAKVVVRVGNDVPLYEDASIAKVSSSLLGEYHLSISPGTEGKRQLVDGDRIRFVIESATTDQILHDVAIIARDAKQISDALARSVGTDQGRENIKETLENLAQVTDALNQTVRENRRTIKSILENIETISSKSQPEVAQILENVREATHDVRVLVEQGRPEDPDSAGEVQQVVSKINRAATSLESALANLDEVTGRLERGEGTLGRLSRDEKLVDDVEAVAEDVGDFLGGLRRLQTIVHLRTDYQYLSAAVKSYVELRLQPREDKYYSIEVVNDPRGRTTLEQVVVDTDNPNQPAHYREVRTVTTNALRFSLQFAQSFGPFTGRFGIKESTGGVGLDTLLFEDRFEIVQDLFGFGEVVLPRWRVGVGYEFVNRLWLLSGVDDILSEDRRDYYLGLQLKFNDEDLKSILPFVGTGP